MPLVSFSIESHMNTRAVICSPKRKHFLVGDVAEITVFKFQGFGKIRLKRPAQLYLS